MIKLKKWQLLTLFGFVAISGLAGLLIHVLFGQQVKLSDDYTRLALYGQEIPAEIVSVEPYRFVTASKYRVGGDEGYLVKIRYYEGLDESFITEKWSMGIEEKKPEVGDPIYILSHPSNKIVKAATELNPEIKWRLREPS